MPNPCEQFEAIKMIESRLHDGDLRFLTLNEQQKKTFEVAVETRDATKVITKRLFTDNGTLSIQTRLDRHENVLKVATWLAGVSTTALIGLLITELIKMIIKSQASEVI